MATHTVWIVARREWRDHLRDGRFWWAAAVLLVLLSTAAAVGWVQQAERSALQAAAGRTQRAAWLDKGDMHPHMAAHYGTFVVAPVAPLAGLDPGVSDDVGAVVFLEAHRQNQFTGRRALDALRGSPLGDMTVALVLRALVPLLILLLAFSSVSGEREQQTLALTLSAGLRPRDLLAGKMLGLAAPLACVLVPAALVGLAAMVLLGGPSGAWATLPRVMVWSLIYVLYFAAVAATAVAVSAAAPTSRQALAALLTLWVAHAVVAPRAAIALAERWRPTPDAPTLDARIQQDLAHLPPFDVRVRDITARLVRELHVSGPEHLPVDPRGFALAEGESESAAIHQRHMDALMHGYERQEHLCAALGVLAPSLAVDLASMTLAGTDIAHHRHFADAAEHYRLAFVQQLNQAIAVNDDMAQHPGDATRYAGYLRGRDLWAQIPAFEYRPPALSWALHRVSIPFLSLLLWTLLAAGAVMLAARHLRPL